MATSTPKKFRHLCTACGRACKYKRNLQEHTRLAHESAPPRYKCGECGKAFKDHDDYESHRNLHVEAKPFECPSCSKKFRRLRSQKKHAAVCQRNPPAPSVPCERCETSYTSLHLLRQHEGTHDLVGKFHCMKCRAAFKHKSSLSRHQKKCSVAK